MLQRFGCLTAVAAILVGAAIPASAAWKITTGSHSYYVFDDKDNGLHFPDRETAERVRDAFNRIEKQEERKAERAAKKAEKQAEQQDDGFMATDEGPCADPNPLALC